MSIPAEFEPPERILEVVRRARWRLDRLGAEDKLLHCFTVALPPAAVAALAGVAVQSVGVAGSVAAAVLVAAAAVFAAVWAWRGRAGSLAAARSLDSALYTKDRIVSAYQFVSAGRICGPYGLAVRDALEKLEGVDVPALLRRRGPPAYGRARLALLAALGLATLTALAVGARDLGRGDAGASTPVAWIPSGPGAAGAVLAQLRARLDAILLDGEMRGWGPRGMAAVLDWERTIDALERDLLTGAAGEEDVLRGAERLAARFVATAGFRDGTPLDGDEEGDHRWRLAYTTVGGIAPPVRFDPETGLVDLGPPPLDWRFDEEDTPPGGPPPVGEDAGGGRTSGFDFADDDEVVGDLDEIEVPIGADDPSSEPPWATQPVPLRPGPRYERGSAGCTRFEACDHMGPRLEPVPTRYRRLELPRAGAVASTAPGHVIDAVRLSGEGRRVVKRRGAYRAVYPEYRTVAEAALWDETIPVGRKAYLKAYFEAIRPVE